jgi:hypothetical protein
VIFMGLTTFPEIARQLIAHGRSPETPAMAGHPRRRRGPPPQSRSDGQGVRGRRPAGSLRR